jgi:hypothetical protein
MTSLYSLRYSRLDEIVVADNDWLAPSEQAELALLRDASRRRQWLAGRWVAKQLVQDATGETDLTKIEILTRNDRRQGVQPRILVRSQDLPWSLSSTARAACWSRLPIRKNFSLAPTWSTKYHTPLVSANFGLALKNEHSLPVTRVARRSFGPSRKPPTKH